jgi:hypothetical protein
MSNGCECGPNAPLHIASAICEVGACKPTCTSGYTACSGVCVDTTVDKSNCGACAVLCNGVCSQSKCIDKAQTVAQVSGYDSGGLAIDATDAYFVDHPGKSAARILKVPLSGGTAAPFVTLAGIQQLTADATDVYYVVDGTGSVPVYRIAKSGGGSTQIGTVYNSVINTVSVDQSFVYVAGGSSVERLPKGGGTAQTIIGDSDGVARATVAGSTVYASTNTFSFGGGDIKSIPVSGGTVSTVLTNLSFPKPVSVLGTNLLVGHISGLTRFDLVSSVTTELFNKGVKHVIGMGSWAYFVHEGAISFGFDKYGGFVGRVPLTGGTVEYLGLVPDNLISGGIVEGFAVDASFVYWTQDMCCVNPVGLVKVPHD